MRRTWALLLLVFFVGGGSAWRAIAAPPAEGERPRLLQQFEQEMTQSKDDPNRAQRLHEPLRQLRRLRASLPDVERMLLGILSGPDADKLAGDVGDVLRLMGPGEKQKVQGLADGGTIPQARADAVIKAFTELEAAERALANSTDGKARLAAATLIAAGNAATQGDLDVALSDSDPDVLSAAAKMARDLDLNQDEWSRLSELAQDKNSGLKREATATLLTDSGHAPPALDAATVGSLRSDPDCGAAASAWLLSHGPQRTASAPAAIAGTASAPGVADATRPISATARGMPFPGIVTLGAVLFVGGSIGWFRKRGKRAEMDVPLARVVASGYLTAAAYLPFFALLLAFDAGSLGGRLWRGEGMIPLAVAALPLCAAWALMGWSRAATSGRAVDGYLLLLLFLGTLLAGGFAVALDANMLAGVHTSVPDMFHLSRIGFNPRLITDALLVIASLWSVVAFVLQVLGSGGSSGSAPEVTMLNVPPLPFDLE